MKLEELLALEDISSNTEVDSLTDYSLEELDEQFEMFTKAMEAYLDITSESIASELSVEEISDIANLLQRNIKLKDEVYDFGFESTFTPDSDKFILEGLLVIWIQKWTDGAFTRLGNVFLRLVDRVRSEQLDASEVKKLIDGLKKAKGISFGIVKEDRLFDALKTFDKNNPSLKYVDKIFGGAVFAGAEELRKNLQNLKCIERSKWGITKWFEESTFKLNRPTLIVRAHMQNVYSLGIKIKDDIISSYKYKIQTAYECHKHIKKVVKEVTIEDIDLKAIETVLKNNDKLPTTINDCYDIISDYRQKLINAIQDVEATVTDKSVLRGIMRTLIAESVYVRKLANSIITMNKDAIYLARKINKMI
jgi:hypothetical protein